MTLTTAYTVTDRYGDSLEIGAVVGTIEVRDLAGNVLLDLDIDEAFDLEDAIHRAIEDAVEQEAELVESDDEADDDTDLVIVDKAQEFSRVYGVDLGKGSFYLAPDAQSYTFNVTDTTVKLFDDPKIGVAPTVADFFD